MVRGLGCLSVGPDMDGFGVHCDRQIQPPFRLLFVLPLVQAQPFLFYCGFSLTVWRSLVRVCMWVKYVNGLLCSMKGMFWNVNFPDGILCIHVYVFISTE